jgi:hypothetical protein
MNTFLLIVATTIISPSGYTSTVFSFQEFNKQTQCEQIAKWINKKYGGTTQTYAQCVKKEL